MDEAIVKEKLESKQTLAPVLLCFTEMVREVHLAQEDVDLMRKICRHAIEQKVNCVSNKQYVERFIKLMVILL